MASVLTNLPDVGLNNSLVAAGVGAVVVAYVATRKHSNKERNPPGPKGLPVVGNILDFPSHQPWFTYGKWREEYGDIVYCNVAGTKIIVLNSLQHIQALLDNRGAIYSERPSSYFANEMLGWKVSPIMHGAYHEWFKPCRKMMADAVGTREALKGFVHMQEHEAHRWLRRVVDEPDRVLHYLRKLAASIVLRVLYGYDVKPGDHDEYVELIEQVNLDLNRAAVPGTFMVDVIPALRFVPSWFPATGWKRELSRMRGTLDEVLTKPINFVKEQLAAGTAQPSFVASQLQRLDWNEARERDMLAWSAEALYTGGADTSISIAYSFLLAMLLFPEVQKKGQEEIDAVCGDQLPTWADRERLPYVSAILTEALRWGVVSPQALPHCALKDDEYLGYTIEKGTLLVPNIWGITRDPAHYPDPEEFRPERHLGPKPQLEPRGFIFGFGRRSCPGQQLGEVSLYLVITSTLATLNVTKKIGADGKPIVPKLNYTGGAVIFPDACEFDITARNARAEALIRSVDDVPYGHS